MKASKKNISIWSIFINSFVVLALLSLSSLVLADDEKNKSDFIRERLVIEVAKPSKEVVANILDNRLSAAQEMLNKLDISEDDKNNLLEGYSSDLEASLTSLFDGFYDQMTSVRQDNINELEGEFTPQEIEQIVSFFDSDLGQKYFQISAQQGQSSQQIGQQFQTKLSRDMTSKLDDFISAAKQISNTEPVK